MVNPAENGFALHDSVRERGAGMRTFVGQGVEAACDVEYADRRSRDGKHAAFAGGYVTNSADGMKVRRMLVVHVSILMKRCGLVYLAHAVEKA